MVVHQTHKESDSCTKAEERETMNKLRSFCGNPIDPNIPGMSPWGEGEGSTTYNISSTNCQFPGKTWNYSDIFWEGHHVQNVLRSSRIVLKNRSFDKKPVVFHRLESRWCQVCNLLCQFLTRSQFGRSAPLCEKWTEKKGNMDKKRGAGNVVKKCMRRDFCARRERGVRKIVIWHPRWVNMRIEFGNFVTHQDGFLVHDDDDDCSDQNK